MHGYMLTKLHIDILQFIRRQIQIQRGIMSRHRRGNSDLAGLKTLKNLKRSFYEEKDTVGRINRTFSNMESPSPNSSGKMNTCPESSGKKYETNEIVQNTLKLAKHFYEEEFWDLYSKLRIYLKSGWQTGRKSFIEHLNKLPYIEQAMQKKTYSEIEEEIIREWKKNTVLYHIRAVWYQHIRDMKFTTIGDFLKFYNIFRDFIGQVLYLYFRRFFTTLEKKGNDNIVDRLTERTSHFIITNSTTWSKIYDKILSQLLLKKLMISSYPQQLFQISFKEFDLQEIELNDNAIDLSLLTSLESPITNSSNESSPTESIKTYKSTLKKSLKKNKISILPKTTEQIFKFVYENKLYDKIKLLISIRQTLEEEIQQHQRKKIEREELQNYKVLDKDDFISCLVCCVVTCDDINFELLGTSIKYFHHILGTEMSQILSKFSCDSYLADLQAVFDYLVLWKEKKNKQFSSLADIQIINYNKGSILSIDAKTNK